MSGPPSSKARYQTEDVVPDAAAEDIDFQRAVKQLDDQQHVRSGWLHARGAFDKSDHAYIVDQQEQQQHIEEAMVDRERAEFAASRARAEKEAEERRRSDTAAVQGAVKSGAVKKRGENERKKRLLPVIIEKKVNFPATKKAKPMPADEVARKEEKKVEEDEEASEEEERGGVLAGLLGGYDSENEEVVEEQASDGGDGMNKIANGNAPSAAQKSSRDKNPPIPLPSAADLLK